MTSIANVRPENRAEKPAILRTVIAGIAAGVVFNVVGFLTFVLLGSGLNGSGPLFDPHLQSAKMIAVWTEIEPLPLFQTQPAIIFAVYLLFGVTYAALYRSVAKAWPNNVIHCTARLTLTIWALSCLFFELLGPFNLLGEPIGLVVLELVFWAAMAAATAATITRIMGTRDQAES